jgi:hypothetical protein
MGADVSRTAKGLVASVVLSSLWAALAITTHMKVWATGLVMASIWLLVSDWIGGRDRLHMTFRQQFEQIRRGWPRPLPPAARALNTAGMLLALTSILYWIA